MSPLDSYERRSWGLGIVLSNNHGQSSASKNSDKPETYGQKQAEGPVSSFFHRVSTGIAAFMTTEIKEPGRSKTQLEDILESYYLSQGRPVPDWVYYPPPDPAAKTEDASVVIDKVPAYKPASTRQSLKEGQSLKGSESETEQSKTKHSSSTSGALKSFTRLNIARLARTTQFTLGANSSSTSTGARAGEANRGSVHDSGFNSPVLSPDSTAGSVPPIDVHIVDSGNTSPGSTQLYGSSISIEHEATGSSDKPPNLVQRSLTMDRWRRKDKQRMGSPISLASLMPDSKDEAGVSQTEGNVQKQSPPDSLGLGRPQLTSSKSDPFKQASRSVRSKFSVRLGHRSDSNKDISVDATEQIRTKHTIPGKMKRLFRRRSSHEQ
ncbi:hypothetical protein GGI19_000974 [Coemansia pectinata]|uniref:Uncharacterized protein n=1 Tax=Coemansia pectinata TaxID=1052879 RepID=A0A9W8H5P1_9FUNG|nr:hypothetical protein GGI19_000974 [Coemansia pectinata]